MCTIEKFEIKKGDIIDLEDLYNRKHIFFANSVMFLLENGCVYNMTFGGHEYKLNLPFSVKDIEYCVYGIFILSETGQLYIYNFEKSTLDLFIDGVLSNIKNGKKATLIDNSNIICMHYVETTQGDIIFRDTCDVKIHLSNKFEKILRKDHNSNFIVLLKSDFTVKLIDINNDIVLRKNISNEIPETMVNFGLKLKNNKVLVRFIYRDLNGNITDKIVDVFNGGLYND